MLFFLSYLKILTTFTDLMSSHGDGQHEQQLLRNMGAHTVVLDLLQINFDKVYCVRACVFPHVYVCSSVCMCVCVFVSVYVYGHQVKYRGQHEVGSR